MEFRRRHGCLRNQAMRGLRISSSTPADAAPSLSLRHGTGSSRVRMAFLYALLQSIGRLTPEEITIGIDVGYATCVFAIPDDAPRPIGKGVTFGQAPQNSRGGLMLPARLPYYPSLEWEIIKRAEVAHLKTCS
jgi:hypothetical protein